MVLARLDSEIIFKKAFTDKFVFTHFVKDIIGIDVEVDKIETEKQFENKVANINFKLDIFAETTDKRIVIEIQRVEYDHNFDRFLHYFFSTIVEQQKKSANYGIEQIVYLIVMLTEPYTITDKTGQVVRDEVLLLEINPRNLVNKYVALYGHQLYFLNPNYRDTNTPPQIRDWLNLVYQSIHHSQNPTLNTQNQGVMRAADLITYEKLSPEEVEASKNAELAREKREIERNLSKEEGIKEGIEIGVKEGIEIGVEKTQKEAVIKGLQKGLSPEILAEITNLSLDTVMQIKAQIGL
jgi:hypothetical protein